ncbi:hypothetical protein N656DRAFT_786431 [Canariomyces notabilis]|uniref:Uncharacterized protein n=1 Tax=Canariomyces notabilis TaxID=2074819 RepID=A0AAN6TNJ8_9PEZI|nr:hypothetical protein N656DRAFT_786431 [Canariomyces arenarius]
MSGYYEPSQWPPTGQSGWDHQTPPPARSGASSTIPREEPAAFTHQLEEVDRAIDNLLKSGKMFGAIGGRRESLPYPGPARMYPAFDGRPPAGPGSRPHSMADYGDARGGPHPGSNLQNFYASQRHQTSRGSNEAEQMMQAKRRMAAQRERELRNYHQEQQYNRTVLAEISSYGGNKPDRTISPGSLSEEDRRKLIAQQRSALYGDGSYAESGGYVDETGAPRGGLPAPQGGPAALRGHSPMTYDYSRVPPIHTDVGPQPPVEGGQGSQSAGPNERSRANSNSSPQSNPPAGKGVFDAPAAQQSSRTSASSPGGSPPRQGAPGSKPGQGSVAPIGTRPSVSNAPTNPALNKRSTTPLPSPLSQGYTASGNDETSASGSTAPANASSSAASEGPNIGLSGWGSRPNGWGSKPGLGVQASVWG